MTSLSLVVLLWTIASQSLAAKLHGPAVLISSNATLKPLIGKSNGGSPIDAYFVTNPLNRLLLERQSSCPGGYGQCSNEPDKCCLLSTSCCANNDKCCPSGQFCYSTGCCENGTFGCEGNSCCPTGSTCCTNLGHGCCSAADNCVVVGGQEGCCPKGQTCGAGGSTQCSISGYVPCSGDDFCCPAGDTCFRDSTGDPACSRPGSGNPTTVPSTLTPTPSITFTPEPTPTPTTFTSTHVNASPFTQSFPASSSAGMTNSTVSATDPRISYGNGNWTGTMACSESSKTTNSAGSTLTFQFIGTAIFMTTVEGPEAGLFTVSVDGGVVSVDASVQSSGCGTTWSSFNLQNLLHTVIVTYEGGGSRSAADSTAAFTLSHFIITQENGGTGTATATSSIGSSTPALSWATPVKTFVSFTSVSLVLLLSVSATVFVL